MEGAVYVTGMGIVSAIGNGVDQNLYALLHKQSGIVDAKLGEKTVKVGRVPLSNEQIVAALGLGHQPISRTALLGMMAAREAWGANEHRSNLRTGFISATSVGGMDRTEVFYEDFLTENPADFAVLIYHDSGRSSEDIAQYLGINGWINTISTACSSGANAIMMGARMIQSGRLDRVLVGGTDALTRFTIHGFDSLMIYDRNWTRPFDNTRAGLNLGEGAAYLLLESAKSLEVTGSNPVGYVTGWGNSADAFHQTASSPEGKGAVLAMKQAMRRVSPSAISYINAHGTGTPNNDASESEALLTVFEGRVPPFSSTKAYTGHTLAAAGAIEAVFSLLAIREKTIWPNLNFSEAISKTALVPVIEPQKQEVTAVLSNSFGFGGNNSSLVFSPF